MPADVLIVNLVVLGAVLVADLGTRGVTWRRALRPVVVAAVAIAVFIKVPQTTGTGLALELIALGAGVGLAAAALPALMPIRTDARTGRAISVAGPGYAMFWMTVIGARLIFTYGANHWYSHALGPWLTANGVTVSGLTDALILFAIGLVGARAARVAWVLVTATTRRPHPVDPHTAVPAERTISGPR